MATKQAIQAALERFERNIQEEGFKLSIADYVKLLQLKQELAEDDVREIKVRWVEPAKKSSGR